MRGPEDPPSPLDHVLHDGLGLEQVFACVGIKNGHDAAALVRFKRGSSRVRSGS